MSEIKYMELVIMLSVRERILEYGKMLQEILKQSIKTYKNNEVTAKPTIKIPDREYPSRYKCNCDTNGGLGSFFPVDSFIINMSKEP